MTRPHRLRLGILADGTELSRWQRSVLEALQVGGDVDLAALIVDGSSDDGLRSTKLARRVLSDRTLWRLYNNLWVVRRSHAIQRIDCSDLLDGVPRIDVVPQRIGRWSQHFAPDDLDRVRSLDLDVLIRFGFGILRGDVLESARHGVWSFHHDDERVIRGGPPSFWEVADGLPTTGVLLQKLTDKLDAGVPLARVTVRTVGYSYPRNRDRAAFAAHVLPARVARAVRHGWLDPGTLPAASSDAPIKRDPTNVQMLRFAVEQSVRAIGARARGIGIGARWGIGVGRSSPVDPVTVPDLEWLPERSGGYYADPFPGRREGLEAVIVEEFDERSGRGVISAIRRERGGWKVDSNVLDTDEHASYPFLLETDGELYCIPETAQGGQVSAWRCERFPDVWFDRRTILDEPVVDPTIVEFDGRWWLFGTLRGTDANSHLHLWSAPAWDGPWAPHPLNPVKIDVRSARPAGTPFIIDGVLYRPAQDCSRGYGGEVVINRVDRLDDTGFDETVVETVEIDPSTYDAGNHTLSYGGGMMAVDGKRRVIDLHRSRRELVARLRRIAR